MSSHVPHLSHIRYTQNFLKSDQLVDLLLDRSSIGPDDLVLEIGPGKGQITRRLAARCRCLIAVEMDEDLVAYLRERLGTMPNVVLYLGDALTFPLPAGPYKVFSSIPFNITAPLISKLTSAPHLPDDLYLVIQREAAERVLGVPSETLFALSIKPWFEPSLVHRFSPQDFDPPPRVEVVMLRLQKRGPPLISEQEADLFRDFATYCFRNKGALSSLFRHTFGKFESKHLAGQVGLQMQRGPASIRFEQWVRVFRLFIHDADRRSLQHISGAAAHLQREQQPWLSAIAPRREKALFAGSYSDYSYRLSLVVVVYEVTNLNSMTLPATFLKFT